MEIKLVTDSHKIGVEIEIENAQEIFKKKPRWWNIKEDGSLRDNGAELVFSAPYSGADAIHALEEAYEQLLTNKMQISPRTGIHVHVDVRDMSIKELKRLCVIYALVEEPLFAWVGNHRDSNTFCLPWYEAEGDIGLLCKILSKEKANIIKDTAGINRYSALNLNAINRFGSIEFRHLQTTKDVHKVVYWINMLLSIKLAAKDSGTEDASTILKFYHKYGKHGFVKAIFREFANDLLPSTIKLGELLANELVYGANTQTDSGFYAHLFPQGDPQGYSKFTNHNGNAPKRIVRYV